MNAGVEQTGWGQEAAPGAGSSDLEARFAAARSLPPQQKVEAMKALAREVKASGQATEVLDGVVDTAKQIVERNLLH